MAAFPALLSNSPALGHYNDNSMLAVRYRASPTANTTGLVKCQFVPKWMPSLKIHDSLHMNHVRPRCAVSRGGNYGGSNYDDEYREDPLWLELSRETFRALKSLFTFLAEQPGQLKYLEWPSFQDTLRTASLTLVLVAVLIVALSSIDSALSYVLALLLRKPA